MNYNLRLPKYIDGYGKTTKYKGPFTVLPNRKRKSVEIVASEPGQAKLVGNLGEMLRKVKLEDGMEVSFHHHLRNGDYVLNLVIEAAAKLGIKNLTLHASSLTSAHEPLVKHIEDGIVTGISTSGLRGKLGRLQSEGKLLANPIVFRTHGGRARAIEAGEINIDVAFIATSACDVLGNMNGLCGKSAFGAMGYPMVDAYFADKVVAITDNLQPFPLESPSIPMNLVDYVVEVESIGDPERISSGATRVTKNPTDLLIAKSAAEVLIASGIVKSNFSFQAGSGGPSLAVCKYLREYMIRENITGSFASGGITNYLVEMLNDGLFNRLLDTQTFDARAIESLKFNEKHIEMSASVYANPHNKSCVAHQLDIMVLSATEIDEDFNLNSITGSTGFIMGALGGAPDTAAGSKLTVVVAPTMRNRIPIVVEKVTNVVTPGETIDVLVTEKGICVNPIRSDIIKTLGEAGIKLTSIESLRKEIQVLTGIPDAIKLSDDIVGIVEYRDGSIMDLIYRVDTKDS